MDRGALKLQVERLIAEAPQIAPSIRRFDENRNYGKVTDEDLDTPSVVRWELEVEAILKHLAAANVSVFKGLYDRYSELKEQSKKFHSRSIRVHKTMELLASGVQLLSSAVLNLDERVHGETKEREQKFGILLSPAQASRDFDEWKSEAQKWGNPIAVLFVDIDQFKVLNERLTETKVDKTIFPEVQKLLAKLVQGRAGAYRYGGEEFLLILPNLDGREAEAFAEKVRETFEQSRFEVDGGVEQVTVSIGVAIWPRNGEAYQQVLEAANAAEREAKKTRNTVKVAGS